MRFPPLGPIILDLEGVRLTAVEKEILSHPSVGGVIFFSRNYEEPKQLRALIQEIRALRSPFLLCVDQEGGRVQRFQKGMTRLPALRILGELLDNAIFDMKQILGMSQQLGALMALEIRSLGVDLSFAPVLDVDHQCSEVIGNRAFHSDPQVVSALAKAYIIGMQEAGMQATLKHFPGHGAVSVDSHLSLPEDTRSRESLNADLLPFSALITAGAAGIMPAHIVYSAIDSVPVGFSRQWLQTILREELKFNGTIISDDLSMAGAAVMGDLPDRARQAMEAGCDYILVCNDRPGAIQVIDQLPGSRPDKLTQKRRENMLGRGESVDFDSLRSHPSWKKAYAVMGELAQAIVP